MRLRTFQPPTEPDREKERAGAGFVQADKQPRVAMQPTDEGTETRAHAVQPITLALTTPHHAA